MLTPAELEQRRQALALANEIRIRRADLKRQIRAGRASFIGMLIDPPDWLLTATVYEILKQVPRIGPYAAKRALSHSGLLATTTFGTVFAQQRQRLIEELFRSPGKKWL